jgi:GntR family transcriptional regulator, rspAB operon transcriptional repressor
MNADSSPVLDTVDQPLTAVVAGALRQDILDGVIPPGSRITQDAIAAKYGTSRSPVREALRELAAEGLVTIVPDVGARVTPLDWDELIEAYRMREALEPIAVGRAAAAATPEHLELMRTALERSETFMASGDTAEYLEADRQFHRLSFQADGMPRLMRAIEGLWNTTYRHRATLRLVAERQEVGVMEHRLMLDAFERHASDDAAQLQQIHVRRSRLFLTESANALAEDGDDYPPDQPAL